MSVTVEDALEVQGGGTDGLPLDRRAALSVGEAFGTGGKTRVQIDVRTQLDGLAGKIVGPRQLGKAVQIAGVIEHVGACALIIPVYVGDHVSKSHRYGITNLDRPIRLKIETVRCGCECFLRGKACNARQRNARHVGAGAAAAFIPHIGNRVSHRQNTLAGDGTCI